MHITRSKQKKVTWEFAPQSTVKGLIQSDTGSLFPDNNIHETILVFKHYRDVVSTNGLFRMFFKIIYNS